MRHKKPSRTFCLNLQRMLEGDAVNASAFTNAKLLRQLEDDRVVLRFPSGRNRAVIRCHDPEALRNYLKLHWGIADLKAYIALLDRKQLDGEDSLQATTSTKTLRTRGMQGFFIRAFGVELQVDGQTLKSVPDGVDYFICDWEKLYLPGDLPVVGVENPECFRKAERLLDLFPDPPLVFVLRFYSNQLLSWLESIPNPYLHFGDFDPAGMAIYANEYLPRLGQDRCRFFVPDDIGVLFERYGSPDLFERQRHLWPPNVKPHHADLLKLIELINARGQGVEQEQLLLLNP